MTTYKLKLDLEYEVEAESEEEAFEELEEQFGSENTTAEVEFWDGLEVEEIDGDDD